MIQKNKYMLTLSCPLLRHLSQVSSQSFALYSTRSSYIRSSVLVNVSVRPHSASTQPEQHEASTDETQWKWLICSTESSPHPKGKLIISIPAGALTSLPLLPLPQCQTFAHGIQLTVAQSERLCTRHDWRWRQGELPKYAVDVWEVRAECWSHQTSGGWTGCWIYVTGCPNKLVFQDVTDLAEAMACLPRDIDSCT